MFLGFQDNFQLAVLINFILIKKKCMICWAKISQSWVCGCLRKAENKAKAQHSWGLGFADLGKYFEKLESTPHTHPPIR